MSHQIKKIKRPIDGVLLLDKPVGLTSNSALQKAKRLYNAAKAGHTGTLDPFATGLLPLCLGEATKFSQFLLDADKQYRAEVQLGVRTSSGDLDGDVIATRPVEVDEAMLRRAMQQFEGVIEQMPPMHSALKHHGRPLYEYARQGIEIPRETRRVTVRELVLERLQGERCTLRVHCSKGFYVRALADDLGEALGCGAHLVGLCRLAVGGFTLDNAITLDTLDELSVEARDAVLQPADAMIVELPIITLDIESEWQLLHGQPVWLPRLQVGQIHRIYSAQGQFLGVGEVNQEGKLASKRLIATGENRSLA